MANNVGFALAAEKLMGIEITPRCTVLRVIACEMSRIISHMVWLGTRSIDVVPSHTMCEMMRLISHAITRNTVQRGVIAMPMSRSAARANPTLFAIGDR